MKKQSLPDDHSAWKEDVLSENWCVKVTEVMCWYLFEAFLGKASTG